MEKKLARALKRVGISREYDVDVRSYKIFITLHFNHCLNEAEKDYLRLAFRRSCSKFSSFAEKYKIDFHSDAWRFVIKLYHIPSHIWESSFCDFWDFCEFVEEVKNFLTFFSKSVEEISTSEYSKFKFLEEEVNKVFFD